MRLVIPMPGNETMATRLTAQSQAAPGVVEVRRFPDSESYVRVTSDVAGRDVDFLCTLARPDPQFLTLVFAAETARELGASSVGLVAPYLAYMRQDKRFLDYGGSRWPGPKPLDGSMTDAACVMQAIARTTNGR